MYFFITIFHTQMFHSGADAMIKKFDKKFTENKRRNMPVYICK